MAHLYYFIWAFILLLTDNVTYSHGGYTAALVRKVTNQLQTSELSPTFMPWRPATHHNQDKLAHWNAFQVVSEHGKLTKALGPDQEEDQLQLDLPTSVQRISGSLAQNSEHAQTFNGDFELKSF